ncbi:MAG TPA: ElyC/SanA/YdcF family protein [Terriglobales bacterium]|nr:ElyC/SanA/YdcF family protein [Terriglobales bacterium]
MERPGRRTALIALGALLVAVFLSGAGRFLVINVPERSDAIVVLAGNGDIRYYTGLRMLRENYGRTLFLDARNDVVYLGRTPASLGEQFLQSSAGDLAARVKICPISGDSTYEETTGVAKCLRTIGARRVLLVTSDYHTRRARQIFRSRLPQYQWSVAAATNAYDFGTNWWQHREWAKTTLLEWTKLIWWNAVDRWR